MSRFRIWEFSRLDKEGWTVDRPKPTHDSWDWDFKVDVQIIEVASGEVHPFTQQTGDYGLPSVSPDGTRVAFLGTDDAESFRTTRT